MSKNASAADDASPISAAEANRLFGGFDHFPALVLAVSGGPDSTALDGARRALARPCAQSPRLVAVTVDHGLRKESKREAKAVEKLAHKLGIEHRTLQWTGRKPKTGLQEAARLARYRLLVEVAHEVGARYVLDGAHARRPGRNRPVPHGARQRRQRARRHAFVWQECRWRRAADSDSCVRCSAVPKSRLIATLKAAKIRYADDPSNRDPRFTRSRLRELMPVLAREGLTASRLAALARRVQRVEDTLFACDGRCQQAGRRSAPWPDDGPVTMLDTDVFADLPRRSRSGCSGWTIARAGNEVRSSSASSKRSTRCDGASALTLICHASFAAPWPAPSSPWTATKSPSNRPRRAELPREAAEPLNHAPIWPPQAA